MRDAFESERRHGVLCVGLYATRITSVCYPTTYYIQLIQMHVHHDACADDDGACAVAADVAADNVEGVWGSGGFWMIIV